MIIETIDHGWGPEWPIKQLEITVTDQLLRQYHASDRRMILINSTWYSQQRHIQTLEHLRHTNFDGIVLVGMIDPAIPSADWFSEFQRPVISVGSYRGAGEFVFWAWALARWFSTPVLQDLINTDHMSYAFMNLNRKPHWHRKKLYADLQNLQILDRGLVTMGSNGGSAERALPIDISHQDLSPNSSGQNHGLVNDNVSLGHMVNWQGHFLNVVTETMWDINHTWFVSEKIFKPIIGCRPFLVYDPDGGQSWLSAHGFQSFVQDFRDISDLDISQPDNLAPFLAVLADQGPKYWRSKYLDLLPKIMHNKVRFDQLLQEQKQLLDQGLSCQI